MIHTIEKDKAIRNHILKVLDNDFLPIVDNHKVFNIHRLYEAYMNEHSYSKKRFIIMVKVYLKRHGYTIIKDTNDTFELFNKNKFNF